MEPHKIVSREQWIAARKALLAREKEHTRERDRLSAARRALPWVKVDKSYVFDTPEGKRSLADLFDGRSQLLVYHFMLTPGSDHLCDGCSFISDHIDAARQHFEHNDLSFAAVSRAPLAQIIPVKKRMGWRFTWVSSFGNDFNFDYHVSFTPEQIARNDIDYNFGTTKYPHEDLPGASAFIKNESAIVSIPYDRIHALATTEETGMLGGRGVFAGSKLVLSTSAGAYELEFRGADKAHAAHDLILKRMLG